MIWNDKTIRTLTDMWASDAPASEIALAIGATKDSVTAKARRLDLQRRASPVMTADQMKAKIADALADGMSVIDAGRSIGIGERRARDIFASIKADLGWQAV